MLFIVELKNWWLIIYVLLVRLRVRQPAKGLSTAVPQVERHPGSHRPGLQPHICSLNTDNGYCLTMDPSPTPSSSRSLEINNPQKPAFLAESTKWEFVEKEKVLLYKPHFVLSRSRFLTLLLLVPWLGSQFPGGKGTVGSLCRKQAVHQPQGLFLESLSITQGETEAQNSKEIFPGSRGRAGLSIWNQAGSAGSFLTLHPCCELAPRLGQVPCG